MTPVLKTVMPVTCAQQQVKMICNHELEKRDFENLDMCIYTFAFKEVLQYQLAEYFLCLCIHIKKCRYIIE